MVADARRNDILILEQIKSLQRDLEDLHRLFFGNGQKGIVKDHEDRIREVETTVTEHLSASKTTMEVSADMEMKQMRSLRLWLVLAGLSIAAGQFFIAWELLAR
jgi:hypothetical protein